MKLLLFIASAFLTLFVTSHAAPPGGGFHGNSFRGGFVAHGASRAFRMGTGVRRNFAPVLPSHLIKTGISLIAMKAGVSLIATIMFFFNSLFGLFTGIPTAILTITPIWIAGPGNTNMEQFARACATGILRTCRRSWPGCCYYQPRRFPVRNSSPDTAYINTGYGSTDAAGQQRIVAQDPIEKIGPRADPRTFVPPAVPRPTQTPEKDTQTTPRVQSGVFGNLVLVSWLEEAGKDVIYVQNPETNDVQKITSEPNLDNFRI